MLEKSLIILLLCTSMIYGEVSESSSSSPVSFGGECDQTTKCDPRALLTCIQGTCQCMKQAEMVFDTPAAKCLVKAGERCLYIMGERGDNSFYIDPYSCVPGASCSQEDRTCSCNQDFYETSEGTCSPAGLLGESCTENRHCSGSMGFQCVEGTCQCDSTSSEYNDIRRICVGLEGSQCIQGQCTENADCATNTCVCRGDNFWGAMGKCRPKFGPFDNCTADIQCKQEPGTELKCVKGNCNCDPSTSVYASVRRSAENYYYNYDEDFEGYEGRTISRCVPLPGHACSEGFCAPGAYCSGYLHNDYGQYNDPNHRMSCKCEPSLTMTKRNTCGRDFGNDCTTQDECMDGLACVDKYCKCEYKDQVYDAPSKSCFSKSGGPCYANTTCMENSHCQVQDVGGLGHCVCNKGFYSDHADSCLPAAAFDGHCTAKDQCLDGLACVDYRCKCEFEDQVYDAPSKSCLSKFGGPCNTNAPCIKNSYCQFQDAGGPGHCVCNEGFVPDAEDWCDVAGGGRCNRTVDCDSIANLQCINNLCQCRNLAHFDPIHRKCVGKVGAHCSVSMKNDCVKNSKCEQTHPKLPARCVCNEGYSEVPDYTCHLKQEEESEDDNLILGNATAVSEDIGE